MYQEKIIRYLNNDLSYMQDMINAYNEQARLKKFEEQNITLEKRINNLIDKCNSDMNELKQLLESIHES